MERVKFNSFVYDVVSTFRPDSIDGLCHAKFSLSFQYDASIPPFGFDWIRTGDYDCDSLPYIPYKGNMGFYFTDSKKKKLCPQTRPEANPYLDTNSKMYDKLCKSFLPGNLIIFPTKDGKIRRYHVPVLSIYPYSTEHPIIAHLSLGIEIKNDISTIQLEYDNSLFEITTNNPLSTEKGKHNYEISLKCLKEFARDEYIRVVTTNSKGKRKTAGMLRVCKNAKKFRFQAKILLINTKFINSTEDTAIPLSGDEANMEEGKKYMENMLHHALVSTEFEKLELDLGYDSKILDHIYNNFGINYLLQNRTVKEYSEMEENPLPEYHNIFDHLNAKVKSLTNVENYSAILFFSGIKLVMCLSFNNQIINADGIAMTKYAILGKNCLRSTPMHELLHTFGLGHTFDNFNMRGRFHPFTYKMHCTDNIMDYRMGVTQWRANLWQWQWKKIQKKCKKEV